MGGEHVFLRKDVAVAMADIVQPEKSFVEEPVEAFASSLTFAANHIERVDIDL